MVAGLSPKGAGLSEAVPRLAMEAVRLGHEATIATVAHRKEPLSKATEECRLPVCGLSDLHTRFPPPFTRPGT